MSDTPFTDSIVPIPLSKLLRRAVTTLLAVAVVGWLVQRATSAMDRSESPAGFGSGLIQGALMPAALPNLVVGRDVVIYAADNTGVSYKLGYTLGVNACGAVFFGIVFWRLNRLRKGLKQSSRRREANAVPDGAGRTKPGL